MNTQRSKDIVLLLLRLAFGGAMMTHGWPKLMKLLNESPVEFMDFMGLGPAVSLGLVVGAELFCAGALVLGLFTRWVAIPLVFTMLVAIFKAHWGDPFGDWEMAFLYLIVYICLLIAGPGWYSLDARVQKSF